MAFVATPTYSLSQSVIPRWMMSKWPFDGGSNEPA